MVVQGDIAQISIANILQALFLNAQEGVLTVETASQRRRLRVLKLGIRPLSSKADDPDLLRAAILKEKILTATQFENAISTWNSASLFPGDFLVHRRLITSDQVEHEIREQFEEVIYEIFTAKDLRYEFSATEQGLDHEIFDPDGLGTALIYSVNGILMEAARREDEWRRIETEISSPYEIYVSLNKGLPRTVPPDVEITSRNYSEVRNLLSGDRTVHRIVEESSLSHYEVHQALFQLKSRGYIRRLRLSEKENLAEKLRRTVRNKEAIDVYRSILDEDPAGIKTRTQLIFLLEKGNYPRDVLVEQYLALVERYEVDQLPKALACIEKVLQLDPDHLPAHERLFELHAQYDNREDAMGAARSLLKSVRVRERFREGATIVTRLLNYYPEETQLYHELAELLITCKEPEQAVECLKNVAAIYERRGELHKKLKTYELIVRIDPSETGRLRRIEGQRRRADLRPKDLVRVGLVTVFLAALLALVAWFCFIEYQSRTLFAEVVQAVDNHVQYGQFDRATRTVKHFVDEFWFSTRRTAARALLERVAQEEKERSQSDAEAEKQWTDKLSSTIAKAQSWMLQGKVAETHALLAEILKAIATVKLSEDQEKMRLQIQKMAAAANDYFTAARDTAGTARKALQAGDVKLAHEATLQLLKRYPSSTEARKAKLPVLIESIPSGAAVLDPGDDAAPTGSELGKTPLVVEVQPNRKTTVVLKRPGFQPRQLVMRPTESCKETVELEKAESWVFESTGPIDSPPVALQDTVYVANRNGHVFALSLEGKKRWPEFQAPLDISSGVGGWSQKLYAGCFDGVVYLLDAETGQALKTGVGPLSPQTDSLLIKRPPSAPTERGVVVFNYSDRLLSAIDLTTDRRLWTYTASAQLVGPPQLDAGSIYAFTQDGYLLQLDPHTDQGTGKLLLVLPLGGEMTMHGFVSGGKAFVVLARGEVRAVDVKTQNVLWQQNLLSAPTAPLTVSTESRAVLVPLTSGDLACLDIESGKVRWRIDIKKEWNAPVGGIEAEGVVADGKYYVGTQKGFVLCWDIASGRRDWKFTTRGAKVSPARKISCRGLVHKGHFIQGSDDGFLYCVPID